MLKFIYAAFLVHYVYSFLTRGRDFELLIKDNGGKIGGLSASFVDYSVDYSVVPSEQKPHIYLMDSNMIMASDLNEFYELSHEPTNMNKDIMLNAVRYTLIQVGKKVSEMTHGYGNQQYMTPTVHPMWSLILGDRTLTVSDIT